MVVLTYEGTCQGPPSLSILLTARNGNTFAALPLGLWLYVALECFSFVVESLLFGDDGLNVRTYACKRTILVSEES